MSNRRYNLLSALIPVCLIASNLFETKIFSVGQFTLTGGFLVFPISYIVNDCLTEVYGYRNAKEVILTAFALNALFVGLAQLVRILPASEMWDGQEHFDYIFKADLRITLASMAAFVFGSLINARVMHLMKLRQGERGFGWRAIASSLAGESIDSLIFFPIAFYSVGFRNILVLMATQIVLKTLYEVVCLPLTTIVVKYLKHTETE